VSAQKITIPFHCAPGGHAKNNKQNNKQNDEISARTPEKPESKEKNPAPKLASKEKLRSNTLQNGQAENRKPLKEKKGPHIKAWQKNKGIARSA